MPIFQVIMVDCLIYFNNILIKFQIFTILTRYKKDGHIIILLSIIFVQLNKSKQNLINQELLIRKKKLYEIDSKFTQFLDNFKQ